MEYPLLQMLKQGMVVLVEAAVGAPQTMILMGLVGQEHYSSTGKDHIH
jgi:hypothetical protein